MVKSLLVEVILGFSYCFFFFFFFFLLIFFVEKLGQIQILKAQFFFLSFLGIFKLLPQASVSEPLSPYAAIIGLKNQQLIFFFSLSFGILLLLEGLTQAVDHM